MTTCRALGLSISILLCMSCSDSSKDQGSFLEPCTTQCSPGLECSSGVCTLLCGSDDECSSLAVDARCPDSRGSDVERTCEVTCDRDADCAAVGGGAPFVCASGVCRANTVPGQDPPLAMFLIDTSGSMERPWDCECVTTLCTECLPDCTQGERNRFATVLEALSGTWEDFECEAIRRTRDSQDPVFTYDVGYTVPYHRPPVEQAQLGNGVIDAYRTRVRFGVATLDSTSTYADEMEFVPQDDFDPERSAAAEGSWSYGSFVGDEIRVRYDGSEVGTYQYPGVVGTQYVMDTGIRAVNAENGAILHAYAADDMLDVAERIEKELRRVRTYRGSPIGAALDDLQYYFDEDVDVADLQRDQSEDRHIILISDGRPDNDHRYLGCDCARTDSCDSFGVREVEPDLYHCPYPQPVEAAAALVQEAVARIHVVQIAPTSDDDARAAVAVANEIAMAGQTSSAHIVSTPQELREALREIMDDILAGPAD